MSDNTNYVPQPIGLQDDDILNFTQGIRKDFVDELVKPGLPSDKDDRGLLLELLKDMDRTSLGRMKMNVKERELDMAAQTQMALERITRQFGERSPFLAKDPSEKLDATVIEQAAPHLNNNELPELTLVEGETLVGVEEIRYDSFMAEAEQKGLIKSVEKKAIVG